jgi:hypothetical protein
MKNIWFREMGFYSNPFSIKPAAFHDKMFGYDKIIDTISYGILNNKVIVIQGAYGNGKSSILRRVINDFGGKKQVIYYSCNRIDQRLNIKSLLNGRYGFFGKLFDMKPKEMILLLDEAQELGKKDYEKLYSYYQEGYFKAIVLAGKGTIKENLPSEFSENLEEIALESIDEETAIKIIRKRVGDIELLTDKAIKTIFQRSEKNVRLLLQNCEKVCKYAIKYDKLVVNRAILDEVIPKQKKEEPVVEEKKEVKREKVRNIPKKREVTPKKEEVVPKKEEKKAAPKKKEEAPKKKEVTSKKEEKKAAPKKANKNSPKEKPKKKIYNPDQYKNMVGSSAEEMLNKGTDEIFNSDQYY